MSNYKHGKKWTRVYGIWCAMRSRCGNPNTKFYELYGGRGITVCDRWQKFDAFLEDMGEPPEGHSIERIDNDKGYSKDNCKWIPLKDQAKNRRSARMIEAHGKNMTLTEWAEQSGIDAKTIWHRLNYGWSADDAVTKPIRKSSRFHKFDQEAAHK
jgi:hypothetical protein